MGKPDLKWSEEEEDEDFDAAFKYLSLLRPEAKARALVKKPSRLEAYRARRERLVARGSASLLPSDEPHVDQDLKRIQKSKALAPVLLVRGDMGNGLPLVVADGYHRICAVVYFDESAPVRCQIADIGGSS